MGTQPDQKIRLLLVEDTRADADRAVYQFTRAGLACEVRRVETGAALLAALEDFSPSLILSDFSLPQFDGMSALRICRERAPEVPFVFLSGTIGEERAIGALQAGAADYVLKENMARLVPAALRAINDAQVRAERVRQDAQIARLNQVLRMLKGVNELAMRCRDRADLLTETCRLAISLGDYAMAVAATRSGDGASVKALAANGLDGEMTARLSAYVEESARRDTSVIGRVLRTGKEFIGAGPADLEATARFDALLTYVGLRSVVVLPLLVDGEVSAVLLLAARQSRSLDGEELDMLRDLARTLSFGLQYVHRDTRARFLSHFDPQTGLARRSLFCERVRDTIAADATEGARHAVALFDVRRLGAINDSFGRHAGDLLLRQIADSLKRYYPRQEQLGQFGGGTFALMFRAPGEPSGELQSQLQQQAQHLFGKPFRVDGQDIPVSVRTSCAVYPADGVDAMTLVQNAETALQVARGAGQVYARFDPAAQNQAAGQLALEHRLRLALERLEFELHYQPKVNVITRRIQGAEALLRWRSPEDGLVAPDVFLPVLESSGLIVPVGQWVLAQAAKDCRFWMQAGLPAVRVAVNIAPAQLRLPDFEEQLLQIGRSWPSARWGLDVEITEGMLQEDSAAEVRKLQALRAAGIRIAIDDFGTGYSSLSRLSALPVDTLKIDRRFISQMVDSPTGATVVKTVVTLAHAFKMTCVAEGVERQQELDLLWHMGCDQSQGYLHSPALRRDEFAAVLQNGKGVLMQPPEPGEEQF